MDQPPVSSTSAAQTKSAEHCTNNHEANGMGSLKRRRARGFVCAFQAKGTKIGTDVKFATQNVKRSNNTVIIDQDFRV